LETLVNLYHVVEKGARQKGVRASQASSRMGVQETISDAESEDGMGSGGNDMDQLRDQNFTRKCDGDLHDLVHILAKRRKVHVC
jgi:hypothetical protein